MTTDLVTLKYLIAAFAGIVMTILVNKLLLGRRAPSVQSDIKQDPSVVQLGSLPMWTTFTLTNESIKEKRFEERAVTTETLFVKQAPYGHTSIHCEFACGTETADVMLPIDLNVLVKEPG